MKKFLVFLLCSILVVGLFVAPSQALADTSNRAFGFTAFTDGTTLSNAGQYALKEHSNNIIEVRHTVSNSNAGYTNRIYGHIQYPTMYAGAKWQAPNGIYYSCTSNNLIANRYVTPGGRGNTDYATYQGLSTVRIEGQFRTH